MKTICLFLTVVGLGAVTGGAALAEASAKRPESAATAGAGKPATAGAEKAESEAGRARVDQHSGNHAGAPNVGEPPVAGVSESDALAVDAQLKRPGGLDRKKPPQTDQASVVKKQAEDLNRKGSVAPTESTATTAHNPATPWGLPKTSGPHDRVSAATKDPKTPAVPWGLAKTASPHDRVATVSKEPNNPATPWGLAKTADPHDRVPTVSTDPKLELKPVKSQSLPTEPVGLSAESSFAARTSNIDRQHSPGLVAIAGTKFPSPARNTVSLNGLVMKHKP